MINRESTIGRDVRKYCAEIGADPLLVQGAGGNVSWKENGILWIKSSGSWLANAELGNIFIPIDLTHLQKSINYDFESINPIVIGGVAGRPSIETALHALLPQKIVIHLHSVDALACLVRKDARTLIHERIGDTIKWSFIDYFKPGIELANAVRRSIGESAGINVVFMKNHGLVIGADSIVEAKALLKTINLLLRNAKDSFVSSELPISQAKYYTPISDQEIHLLATEPSLYFCVKNRWPICPDHVVFLGSSANCFSCWSDFNALHFFADCLPELIFIENVGVFKLESFSAQKYLQLRCFLDVLVRQDNPKIIEVLDAGNISDLVDWDAEKYRKEIVK